MSAPRRVVSAAATLMLLAAVSAEASQMAPDCAAPQEITRFAVRLPNTARAIRSGQALVIVAIGSSSTRGMGASDPAHTYPAQLAEELRARWPQRAVTVINNGVNGEMAPQMRARFESDVAALPPAASHLADRQQPGAEERGHRGICRHAPRGNPPSQVSAG